LEHLAAIQGLITTIAALDPITAGFPRFVTLAARTDNEIRRQKSIERISEAVTDYYDIQRAFATEEDVKRKRALINQSLAVLSTVQRSLFPLAGPFTESEELPWLLRPMILWLQNEHKARVDDFNKLYTSEEAPEWEDIGVEVEHGEQPLNWYWDKLSTGEGLIKIVGPDGEVSQEVEFPSEIRAMFMRLLAVPIGRRLLRSILENARNHEVVIRELRPLEYGAGPAVALGREPHLGRTPGVGSAVEVAIASGFSDLELLNEDELQRHILIPAFLVLGHELVHALHIVEGREAGEFTEDEIEYREWRKKRGGGGYTTGSETLESVWTAAEEEKTIAIPDEEAREIYFTNEAVRKEADKRYLNLPPESQSAAAEQEILQEVIRELIPTENTLRLQLGLPLRHGHGGKWLRSIPPGARKPELTVKRSQYEQLS
jgi:hypothetical protein